MLQYKTTTLKKSGGRNNQGKITTRHKGGGHKKKLRIIDKYRKDFYQKFQVFSIINDPIRNANLALLQTFNKKNIIKLIIYPVHLKIGHTIIDCIKTEQPFNNGYSFFVKDIPVGIPIFSVQNSVKKPIVIARSAGTSCEISAKDLNSITLQLPSGKEKKISKYCRAVIGITNNHEIHLKKISKAGENRWRGKRPSVRGLAINPVDHPHGGGEGKSRIGRIPVNPWGKIKKGKKK